jgi:hypothetical protein
MVFVWIGVAIAVLALDIVTIVDAFRRPHTTAQLAAWIALILIFPLLGALAYWIIRKPQPADLEGAYRAEADLRRTRPPA